VPHDALAPQAPDRLPCPAQRHSLSLEVILLPHLAYLLPSVLLKSGLTLSLGHRAFCLQVGYTLSIKPRFELLAFLFRRNNPQKFTYSLCVAHPKNKAVRNKRRQLKTNHWLGYREILTH